MFREIAEGVHLQPSLLYQTACLVIADSHGVTAIDPGYFDVEIADSRALFDALAAVHGGVRRLALTHSDFDHIVGAPAFRDAQCLTSADWDEANEARALGALRRFDAEHYIERATPLKEPVRRDVALGDGDECGAFVSYGAKGHTDDGLVLYHRPSRVLIVGDYLSDLEFPFIYTSATRYRETLEKLAELVGRSRPALLVSQHGRPAVGASEISARLDEARRYLGSLLTAAEAADTPEEAALRSGASWRGRVPDHLWEQHLENARIALRDQKRV